MQVIKPVVILGLLISSLLANAEDRGRAYVSNQEGGVSIINLNTMETEGTIDIQAKNPRGIGITEDGQYLITANKDDENLSVIDLKTNQFVKHISVGKIQNLFAYLEDKSLYQLSQRRPVNHLWPAKKMMIKMSQKSLHVLQWLI
jgi:YVTN family beta-propeller protein